MHKHIRLLALVAGAACLAGTGTSALAQWQLPPHTVKFGGIRYDPHSKTDGISGIGLPAGADADVGAANTFLLTLEVELKPNVGAELVLGVPPRIKAKASGSVAFLGEVLSARNVAPTLLINYHFGDVGATWRPYVGLGLNYTKFTGARSPYGYDIHLSDSWGLAGAAGVDYALSKRFGLFGSIGYADVKSKLVATGATVLQTTINFRPLTYSLGAFYRF